MSFTSDSVSAPRWRDVHLAAAAKAVSYTGDYLAATALALTLQVRGDNGYGVAALFIAATLPVAILAPLGGRLADRVDSRTLLVATAVGQAVACAALAYTDHPAAMVALIGVLAAGLAITQPVISALIPDMVGRQNLPRAMSISQTAGALGMLVGPVIGALLVAGFGVRLPLLLDAATYLALAVAGLMIRTRRGGPASASDHQPSAPPDTVALDDRGPGHRPVRTPRPAWRIRDDRLLMTLMVSFASVIAAVTAVNVVEIFFVRETLGASEVMYGLVAATWTLGVLVGAWPFGRLGGNDQRLVTTQLWILAALCTVVLVSAGVPGALWLVPLYFGGGLLNAGLNVLSGVVLGRRTPAEVRGRVFGAFTAVGNAANVIGYFLGGVLLPLATPRTIIAGTGTAGVMVAAMFLVPMVMSAARRKAAARVATGVSYVEQR